jgi:hypothetical protein
MLGIAGMTDLAGEVVRGILRSPHTGSLRMTSEGKKAKAEERAGFALRQAQG